VTPIIYINGSFLPEAEAMVNVDDGGWLHGAGLFETMRAEHGRVFRFEQHIDRLRRSTAVILRRLEPGALPGEAVVTELLRRNDLSAARLRLTLSAGPVRVAIDDGPPPLSVCLTASPLLQHPQSMYERGVQVVICPHRVSPSDPIAGHKTTSYLPRLIGLRTAQRAGALDALWFTTDHHLAEGCISNVFVVTGGILRTPPLDTPVLPGIARGVVLELARDSGIELREEPLTIDDLLDADEVFLTNAIMQIMPVIRVEKHDINKARVGEKTRGLITTFRGLTRSQ
jgi:branched-chain amino acid aminotransferase